MCISGHICLIALSWAHFVRMLAGSSGGCPEQPFSRKGMKSQTQQGRWPLTACYTVTGIYWLRRPLIYKLKQFLHTFTAARMLYGKIKLQQTHFLFKQTLVIISRAV